MNGDREKNRKSLVSGGGGGGGGRAGVVAVAVVSNYLKYLSILSEVSKIGKPDFFPMSQKIILNTLILFAIMLDCC